MRRSVALVTALVGALAFGACGGGTAAIVAPARVPNALTPSVMNDGITISEYLPARSRFARAGASSLVADGKVWAIRKGQTLVGTLQASTVKNDVDLSRAEDRKQVIDGVMTGARYDTIYVGSLKVLSSTAADHSLYLWFGPHLFEVLQVKAGKVVPDDIAGDLIEYQRSAGLLR
ncbi:MAG TPA: hypothetical protein VHD87_07030 [Acidimicrobiales bacterium]|nr:hypothetical protein [Acidimicrobiales bacterium]